jgi:hypothetical protein
LTTFNDIIKSIQRHFRPRGENNFTSGKSWDEQQADLGAFQYSEDGFTLTYEDYTKTLKWDDITELNVYITNPGIPHEETTIEIVFGDKQITITEALPGWYQFVSRTKNIFPTIPKDWDTAINTDDGQTNYRTIYRRTPTSVT